MKCIYHLLMMVSIMGCLLISCTLPEEANQFSLSPELIPQNFPSLEIATDQTLTQKEIRALQLAGFTGQQVEVLLSREGDVLPKKRKYLIGGDMMLSEENLRERAEFARSASPGNKQYRHGVTVGSQYPTIRVHGVNMTENPELIDALQYAVARYNELDIRHDLVLSFVSSDPRLPVFIINSNIISVVPVPSLGVEGAVALSDLPSMYGNPGLVIDVLNNITGSGATQNFFRHLMMHEIGHALGMQHTDWFDPMSHSCNRGSTTIPVLGGGSSTVIEPSPLGGVHIPGTPRRPNSDGVSIFRTCHPGSFAQTNFSEFDKIALKTIFPVSSSGGGSSSGCLCPVTERCLNGECIPL